MANDKLDQKRTAKKYNEQIGRNLTTIRNKKQKSRNAIAEALNVTYQQVAKFENGDNGLKGFQIYILKKELKVPFETFFDGLDEVKEIAPCKK